MRRRNIFLSYRRGDIPGYVRILEQQLEAEFGDGRVFRDTSDIPGGAQWRDTIEKNLRESAALLLIIGPHWERIWCERAEDDENYIAYELQLARKHNVKVIPVSIDGVQISPKCDLGELEWIRGPQNYDLSDRQNRWSNDFRGLVALLEKIENIGPARNRDDKTGREERPARLKWLVSGAAGSAALLLWAAWSFYDPYPPGSIDDFDGPFAAVDDDAQEAVDAYAAGQAAAAPPVSQPSADLTGTWEGMDGTIYLLYQHPDGSVEMQSPGYTYGQGVPLPHQPGTYTVQLAGVGTGQFSVAADGDLITGWIDTIDGRINDRLVRID